MSPWIEAPLDAVWLFSQESNKKITSDTDLLYSWELPNSMRWETMAQGPNTETQTLIYPGRGKKRKRKKRIYQSREIGERGGCREAVGRRTAAAEP